MLKRFVAAGVVVLVACGSAAAQSKLNADSDTIRFRQRISLMEATLERAVLNGADNVLDQVKGVMQDRPILSGTPRVSGVRLEGYGVVFNVQVPGMILPIMWPLRQIVHDTQTRGAEITLQQLQRVAAGLRGEERTTIENLIRNLEQQLGSTVERTVEAGRGVTAAALVPTPASAPPPPTVDKRVVDDPEGAYTREVKAALVDAMLEYSQFPLGPEEWLTIVARGAEPRDPLVTGNSIDTSTWVMRIKGSDLTALRMGSITLDEARKRVQVREE